MVGFLTHAKSWALAAAFLLPFAPPLAAETGGALADSVVLLPEYRVEQERPAETRRRLPTAFSSEITLGNSARALESIGEVLGQVAGVRVVQYGGLGAFSTVSIRGAAAGHVAVYLDGVPLTSASQGVVNLADLPVTAVERIEVYRGAAPLELGAALPGGAINLVTVRDPALRELRVTRGSFETWEGRTSWGGQWGPLSTLVHASYRGSEGDFRYPDDNGTPFNAFDDSTSTRHNNRFDATTWLAKLAWQIDPSWRLSVRGDHYAKAQGVPGLGVAPAAHARLSFQRSMAHAQIERRAEALWPRLQLAASYNRERSRFRDTHGELGLGFSDTDDLIESDHASLFGEWPHLPLGFSFEATGSVRNERARLHDAEAVSGDPPASRRRTVGAGVGVQWQLGEPLLLHAAQRWDRIEDHIHTASFGGRILTRDVERVLRSPQIGLLVRGPLGVEARANWSDGHRPPDFVELFGNQGSVRGNPDLVPEQAENWDAGLGWSSARAQRLRGSIEWAHFVSRARDLVVYVRNSQSSVKARNISRARIDGDELSARLEWSDASSGAERTRTLALSGSFTWQTSLDDGDVPFWKGKYLPQRPSRQAYVRLDGSFGRWRATVDIHEFSDNYLDRYNRYRVAGRTLVGASISFAPFSQDLRFTLEGKNLGDNRVWDLAGFPLPGRSFFVSCQAHLGRQARNSGGTP